MPTKHRDMLTIPLRHGYDDDLIAWRDQVDASNVSRSQAAREMLRRGIGNDPTLPPAKSLWATEREANKLKAQVHELEDQIAVLRGALSQVPKLLSASAPGNAPGGDLSNVMHRLDNLEQQNAILEEQNELLHEQSEWLFQRLTALSDDHAKPTTPRAAPILSADNARGGMSDDDLESAAQSLIADADEW